MENTFEKRVLFTGGCGFIGNHLVRYLVKNRKNWQIINYDALTYAGVKENLADIENEENYVFIKGDITCQSHLQIVFEDYKITDVIHLAAESHVDRSLSAPMVFAQSNTIGTVTLLEEARKYWTKTGGLKGHRFYYFSTDEVFGFLDEDGESFKETTPINPSSPYSASKAAGDLFVKAYNRTYGMETNISHCCNAIGPAQMTEKLVPATIQRILNNEPIIVYDKGEQVREWIYTDDIVSAAMTVFEKGVPGEAYNIGSGQEVQNITLILAIVSQVVVRTAEDYVDFVKKYENAKANIKYVENARPGHDFRYSINHDKITRELGWKPTVTLMDAVERTVKWYLLNRDWVDNLKNRNKK